ncbi:AAA family ATPase [Methylotenera sp.]|jgi:wobble nucleotide-excising tRNase|uniref:AAA family ATPase n=1 Tax=Methylotenera sp. TaxID=2051956 RepID=UPI002735575E|nr:AAA family ATPase [Methylotenera sp.]MDP3306980.1 AAA family ATPase [Methylotenera sp.]
MTIKNISKLNGFGIFNNYTNTGVQNFGKYNLFYGWNGSGKSTLSNLFRCIENRSLSEKFPTAAFTVNIEDGSTATQDNLSEANLNIYTFNQDFIDENISWNTLVKSILLVDKEKIADLEKLDQLKKQQKIDTEANSKETQEIVKLEASIAKFGTDSARHMKTSLQSIDTTDRYYLNYDKRKFEDFVDEHLDATKSDTSLLDDVKIIELTNAAKPNQKSQLSFTPQIVNHETFTKAKTRLDDLLKTSVVSQTIQRLLDHSDIKAWVETGLELHKQHDSNTCEFCGNQIALERIKQFEAHFNDDYKSFQERLARADEWLSEQYIQQPQLPVESDFYDEFKKEYAEACASLEKAIKALNAEITEWHNTLKSKTNNPLEAGFVVKSITEGSIKAFIDAIAAIESAVQKHNHKSSNFQEETTKAKKQLELHYATMEVKSFEYHQKKKDKIDRATTNNSLKVVIDARKIEIRTLEDSLSNESLGAEQFNESLHKFLGRSELTLHFDKDKKGYEILRNDSEQVHGKLSEGEKTAIAFVYFITKLHENDNKMQDTIVVVDDPVSSFDSNHLFHAYSFLRTNCNLANQIFVLTHNFTYFKLIRDWFEGVNRGRKRKQKDPNAFFFTIEASTSLPRHSTIKNADGSLVNYDSEYHYIFSKLHNYINNPTLSRDEAFLTANLSRKLLESFFSFKYPKHRTDIAQLMDCGLKACKVTDENIKERIYRFINKYSHSAVIEINEDSSENLVGESHNVIGNIFAWIKEVDEVHYNEMLEVVVPQ